MNLGFFLGGGGVGFVGLGADPDGKARPYMAWIWCMVIRLMWCGRVSLVRSRGWRWCVVGGRW